MGRGRSSPSGRTDSSYEVPDSIVSIGDFAFYRTRRLSQVKMFRGLAQIGVSAFARGDALTQAFIPDSVETIGELAFAAGDDPDQPGNDRLTIFGDKESTAKDYAQAAGINFQEAEVLVTYMDPVFTWTGTEEGYSCSVYLECIGDPSLDITADAVVTAGPKTLATCISEGGITYTARYRSYTDQKVIVYPIDPDNHEDPEHNLVLLGDKEATEFEDGYTGDTFCLACRQKTAEGQKIPAWHVHEWSDWTVIKEATETEEGTEKRTCSACNAVEERKIPALSPGTSGQPSGGQPSGGQPSGGQSSGGQSSGGQSSGGQSSGGQPSGGQSSGGQSSGGQSADGKPSGGQSADGKPSGGQSADGKPSDGKTSDGKPETEKIQPILELNFKGTLPLKVKQKFNGVIVTMAKGDKIRSVVSKKKSVVKPSFSGNRITLKAGKKAGSTSVTITLDSGLKKTFKVKVQKKTVKTKKIK